MLFKVGFNNTCEKADKSEFCILAIGSDISIVI